MTSNSSVDDLMSCFPVDNKSDIALGTLILNGLITTILVAVGCAGNVFFCVKVKHKFNIGQSLRSYLIALSIWDCAVLICAFGYYGLFALCQLLLSHNVKRYPIWKYMLVTFHGPLSISTTGSAWTTVAIAFARYFAVSRPLHNFTVRTSIQPKWINMILACVVVVYCIPSFFELTLIDCVYQGSHEYGIEIWPYIIANPYYQVIYRTICYLLLVSVGPFVVTLAMSMHLIYLLKRRISNSRQTYTTTMHRNAGVHRKAGVLLSILLAKFLLCYILPTFLMICRTILGAEIGSWPWVKILADFGNFFIVFNSSTNFLVYLLWQKTGIRKKKQNTEHSPLMPHECSNNPSTPLGTVHLGPHFTNDEAKILSETWNQAKTDTGEKMFVRMLLFLTDEYPHITITKGPESLSKTMFEFLDSVLSDVVHDFEIPVLRVQQIGIIHRQKGIHLRNQLLRSFKVYLLSEIFHTSKTDLEMDLKSEPETRSLEISVWNKFLSCIIAEIKFGYLTSQPQHYVIHLTPK